MYRLFPIEHLGDWMVGMNIYSTKTNKLVTSEDSNTTRFDTDDHWCNSG